MEKLQGPIHPCAYIEDQLNTIGCIDEESNVEQLELKYGLQHANPESLRFEEYCSSTNGGDQLSHNVTTISQCPLPNLEDRMPFLQMLQSFDYPPPPFQEPNVQYLLRLQQHQQQKKLSSYLVASNELESCVTNEIVDLDLHSSVKSEIRENQQQQVQLQAAVDSSRPGSKSRSCLSNSAKAISRSKQQTNQNPNKNPIGVVKERRKRKRTRPAKNKEEVETQRMTHIAVERNRRRQMNEHLSTLRSLMPSSYVQRGDQASIIGGAIDFVKELEQLLQSLQAQKKMRQQSEENGDVSASSSSTTSSSTMMNNNMFMPSPLQQFSNNNNTSQEEGNSDLGGEAVIGGGGRCDEFTAESRSSTADIEAVVIHNHVNLKVRCPKRRGQLLRAIVALEDVRLPVLHLNITSLHSVVDYSFNLKIEDDCNLRSADDVVAAVHEIFSLINNNLLIK